MRKASSAAGWVFVLVLCLCSCGRDAGTGVSSPLRVQLNWFHDPTFTGEYRAAATAKQRLTLLEGGVNISPLQRLRSGLADIAVVGIDVALQSIESDFATNKQTSLRIIYADFQRNPVGWVLHPRVVRELGFGDTAGSLGKQRNDFLFEQFRAGSVAPGDKRGTETTAVWSMWRQVRGLQGVKILPVGFDSALVLDAPKLAYPVYLNEEPFKLSEKIGEEVVVFDPADDGVVLYGNVLVTTAEVLQARGREVEDFVDSLSSSWRWAQSYPDSAVPMVREFYPDVSEGVLRNQILKTVEFVFYDSELPGAIDLQPGGRMDSTIIALQQAGLLSSDKVSLGSVASLIWNVKEAAEMNWNEIADSYLAIDEDRERILVPTLASLVRESGAKSLVDIGGGDGRILELMIGALGAEWFSAIALTDPSPRMLERARNRLALVPKMKFCEVPALLEPREWSAALLVAVWMSVEHYDECITLLKSIRDVLEPRGLLYAAVTHPCFRDRSFHSFSTNFDMGSYFEEGCQFRVNLYDSRHAVSITDTHWSLESHFRQLRESGFEIQDLIELRDCDLRAEGAPWLVIVARRA